MIFARCSGGGRLLVEVRERGMIGFLIEGAFRWVAVQYVSIDGLSGF